MHTWKFLPSERHLIEAPLPTESSVSKATGDREICPSGSAWCLQVCHQNSMDERSISGETGHPVHSDNHHATKGNAYLYSTFSEPHKGKYQTVIKHLSNYNSNEKFGTLTKQLSIQMRRERWWFILSTSVHMIGLLSDFSSRSRLYYDYTWSDYWLKSCAVW